MRVERVVPVVAHHEHVTRRHRLRLHVVRRRLQLQLLTPRCPVDVQLALLHLHGVPGHRHDALDEHLLRQRHGCLRRLRRVEDDHIAGEGIVLEPVRDLLGDEPVADVEDWVHGQRRDEPRFGDRRPERQGHREGDEHGVHVVGVESQALRDPLGPRVVEVVAGAGALAVAVIAVAVVRRGLAALASCDDGKGGGGEGGNGEVMG